MDFPTLSRLGDAARADVLRAGRVRRFERSEVLFHAGDAANSMFLLRAGHVSVKVTTPYGETAILSVLGPGSTVGELALLSEQHERSATVTALDAVDALALSAESVVRLRAAHSELDRFFIGLLYGYLRRHDELLMEALYVPAEQRVLRRLLELVEIFGPAPGGFVVPITQETLAQLSGSSRPTTNQVLKAAEAAGLLRVSRGRIVVLDPARLTRRAEFGRATR